MSLTAKETAYLDTALQLLPGEAYSRTGLVAAELQMSARVAAALDTEARELIDDALPPIQIVDGREVLLIPERSLPDWEREYGLPSSGSYELRCARVFASIRGAGGCKLSNILGALEVLLGYRPDATERRLFRCDDPESLTDDPDSVLIEPEEEVYRGFIDIDPALCATLNWTRGDVERLVDGIQVSGVVFEVRFEGFFTDDPLSLTDQDLLAV